MKVMAGANLPDPTVLSLQKTVCLNLLVNLKNYSPAILSLLPVKIRQELLVNVPVHEIWWLEQSKFVEGLDMKTVWGTITHERMPSILSDKLTMSPISKRSQTLKERYMEIIGFIILNKICDRGTSINHYQLALDLIFSVHHCLGISNWRRFLATNPHWRQHFHSFPAPRQNMIVPTHFHNKYYANGQGISDVQLMSLLLDGCCYCPTQMNIFAPSFLTTPIWMEIKYPSVLERFRRFISNTESLWFSSSGSTEPQPDCNTIKYFPEMLSLIVTEMIASGRLGNFKHLYLQAPNVTSLSHLVNSIAYFFAVLTNYENIRTNNCTPYKHLKELTLIHDEQAHHTSVDVISLDCLFRNLGDIINHQPNLEELTLGGINLAYLTQSLRSFLTSLVHHINRPTSNILSINTCSMMLYCFQVIIESFLVANTYKNQLLHLSKVIIDRTTIPVQSELYTRIVTMGESGYDFKHYKFSHMYLPNLIVYWLLHRAHQFRLHTLELHDIRVDPGCSILTHIAKHPNLRVRRLYLSKIEIPHCYITVEDFQILLIKNDLEVLSIAECNLGENGVLQDLTIAFNLLFNYRFTMVNVLNLFGNKLGSESEKNLQNFFSALFSLHKLETLGLDIRYNEFQPRHFALMCAEWKKCTCSSKKRLRQLHCLGNALNSKQKYQIGEMSKWTFI